MTGPLNGVRVLDLTAIISGPMATMMLADQGADVIKVEPPGVGDLTRPMGTQRAGVSAIFANANRSKRSLVVDLKQAEGVALLVRLAKQADVLVQNFRPGAAERMGIGYEVMAAANPKLIYVSISGFGAGGPHSQRRVYDPLIQCASGMASEQGKEAGPGAPAKLVRSIVCDKVTALTAAQAITAALFARERGGAGQHVRLNMLDAAVAFHWPDMAWNHSFLGEEGLQRTPDLADMFRIYKTLDGGAIMVAGSDVEFAGFCRAVGREDLLEIPKYKTLLDRMQNIQELIDIQTQECARRTSADLCAALDAEGVPCSKVNTLEDLHEDEQIQWNGTLVEMTHPQAGLLRVAKPPVDFGSTPATVQGFAPDLGAHSREVLLEAGLTADEVEGLLGSRVVRDVETSSDV